MWIDLHGHPHPHRMEWIDIPNQLAMHSMHRYSRQTCDAWNASLSLTNLRCMECVDISNQPSTHGMCRHLQPTCDAWNASTSPTNLQCMECVDISDKPRRGEGGREWLGGPSWSPVGRCGQSPVNQNVASTQINATCLSS